MYFPLLVFDQDGWLITAILRPGNQGEARLAIPVLKRIVREFRKAWPHVRIIVRADGGFNDPKLYDWCEDQGKDDARDVVHYLIRLKNPPAKNGADVYIAHIKSTAQRTFRRKFGLEQYIGADGKKRKTAEESEILTVRGPERYRKLAERNLRKVRLFGDFRYQAGAGSKRRRHERRVIGIIDHNDTGGQHSFVVTNIANDPPNYLYERQYCMRGKAENFIHELKSLHATTLSCREFYPNQFRLFQYVVAYLLPFQAP